MRAKKHLVVIVGGGFSGIRAAKVLSHYSIFETTLISEDTHFNYHPQLVRTKSFRNKLQLRIPLTQIFPKAHSDMDLVCDVIKSIHPTKNIIKTESGSEYAYDSLILALGKAHTTHAGFSQKGYFSAYSMQSIQNLRRRLIHDFEHSKEPKSIHIVGAGPTGIEFAGEVAELVNRLAKKYDKSVIKGTIHLHEQQSNILPNEDVSRKYREICLQRLKSLNVNVHTNHRIAGTKSDVIFIDATGRQGNEFFGHSAHKFTLGEDTLVRTTDLLEADGYNNVYVVGDSVSKEYGGDIASALYDADFVVHTIYAKLFSKKLQHYDPPLPYLSIPIGYNWAITEEEGKIYKAKNGWLHKRWYDRKHFSKILNRRLLVKYWLLGAKTDRVE